MVFTYLVPSGAHLWIEQTTNSYVSVTSLRRGGDCPGTTSLAEFYEDWTTGIIGGLGWTNTLGSSQLVYYIQGGDRYFPNQGTFTISWAVGQYSSA